jgi:hypothetical protein
VMDCVTVGFFLAAVVGWAALFMVLWQRRK